MNTRKLLAILLTVVFSVGTMIGMTANAETDFAKESPMLTAMVEAGEIPELAERLPAENDIFVENDFTPPSGESPIYGGTMRTPNGGMWYYGPICEEPLFRLLEDGTVEPNVAMG